MAMQLKPLRIVCVANRALHVAVDDRALHLDGAQNNSWAGELRGNQHLCGARLYTLRAKGTTCCSCSFLYPCEYKRLLPGL